MSASDELFAAVQAGDRARVAALLDADPALANARTPDGETALLTALYHQEPEIATLLRARGAAISVHEAAALGDVARLTDLLEADPTLLSGYSHDGWTPLHLAAFFGQTATATLLVERGADVRARSRNGLDNMPLHAALAGPMRPALVLVLLANGAEVNARQHGGYTPLHEAAQNGQAPMVGLLLAHGADPTLVTDEGKTPLALAEEHGRAEAATLMRQHTAALQ